MSVLGLVTCHQQALVEAHSSLLDRVSIGSHSGQSCVYDKVLVPEIVLS
jgi:hypothetical protein